MYDSSQNPTRRTVSTLEDYAAICYDLEHNLSEAEAALKEEVRKNLRLKGKLERVKVSDDETQAL